MNFNFLGRGSAFNWEKEGTNCCFFTNNKTLYIIDAGISIEYLGISPIIDDIENIVIFITHMHPDHISGLGNFLFYLHYIRNKKASIFTPVGEELYVILSLQGINPEILEGLEPCIEYKDKNISVNFQEVEHSAYINAYCLFLNIDGKSIFYSGDMGYIDFDDINELSKEIFNRKIDFYYLECSMYQYNTKIKPHLYIYETLEKIKEFEETTKTKIKEKVRFMHLDADELYYIIENNNFKIVSLYEC